MDDLERRLSAVEMILVERLALEPMPVFAHIEENLRAAQEQGEADPVREAALALLARARHGFDPYSIGYGIQSPDEQPAQAS